MSSATDTRTLEVWDRLIDDPVRSGVDWLTKYFEQSKASSTEATELLLTAFEARKAEVEQYITELESADEPMEMKSELTQLISAINTFDYLQLTGEEPPEELLETLHPREDPESVVRSVWQLAKSQKRLKPEESTYREDAKGLVAEWHRGYLASARAQRLALRPRLWP